MTNLSNCKSGEETTYSVAPSSRAAVRRELGLLPAGCSAGGPAGPHKLHLRPPYGLFHGGADLRHEQFNRQPLRAILGGRARGGQPGLSVAGRPLYAADGGLGSEGGLRSGNG